jgi:hypothetical protein
MAEEIKPAQDVPVNVREAILGKSEKTLAIDDIQDIFLRHKYGRRVKKP